MCYAITDCVLFLTGEERNFALFNYVNEQNAEAERLREEIQQVSVNVSHFCLSFF